MKKFFLMAASFLLLTGMAFGQGVLTDEESKNLDQLHRKLIKMKREMDILMKDVVGPYMSEGHGVPEGFGEDVKVDIFEDDKNMIIKADLPGMDTDRIDVTLERDKVLKIAGTREVLKKEESSGALKQERSFGHFERTLDLPIEGLGEGIKATYKDGVLEVVIPKKKGSRGEKIKIDVS